MKKVLIAVDDRKNSEAILSVFNNQVSPPDDVIILYVVPLGGKSHMYDMISDVEMATFKESVQDTEYKEELVKKGEKILDYYKKLLEPLGFFTISLILREGRPSEEILKVAEEENVDLVVLGYKKLNWIDRLISGCVAKDVEEGSNVPVALARQKKDCAELAKERDKINLIKGVDYAK